MRELSLFSGSGGGLLGSMLLGWEPMQFVEHDPYCQKVLGKRFPSVPLWSDVRDFHPVRWSCDIVTGGFPCQPFSQAGKREGADDTRNMWPSAIRVLRESGASLALFENVPGLLSARQYRCPDCGEPLRSAKQQLGGLDGGRKPRRSWMGVCEDCGRSCLDESEAITDYYFGTILADLAEAGFDAEWCVLGADDVGAPHRRKRLWILAHPAGERREWSRRTRDGWTGPADGDSPWAIDPADVADTEQGMCGRRPDEPGRGTERGTAANGAGEGVCDPACGGQPVCWPSPQPRDVGHAVRADGDGYGGDARQPEPCVDSMAHGLADWMGGRIPRVAVGVPSRVDRLRALGNGQVPHSMAVAWTILARSAGLFDE